MSEEQTNPVPEQVEEEQDLFQEEEQVQEAANNEVNEVQGQPEQPIEETPSEPQQETRDEQDESTSASASTSTAIGSKRKINEQYEAESAVRDPKVAKQEDLLQEDEDEGAVCNICMEAWTNSGDHRIASLKCGHFFGFSCIDRWLKGGGGGCPNCNEKASRNQIRVHYTAKLKAIDTSERDRAVAELEKARKAYRELELQHTTLKVANSMHVKEIERIKEQLKRALTGISDLGLKALDIDPRQPLAQIENRPRQQQQNGGAGSSSAGQQKHRLTYLRRIELIKSDVVAGDREKYCRVMSYSDFHGMLVVTQPSFTALAPGFGIRKINLVDQKAGAFISLHKEPIRDLSFNFLRQDQLLSVSQDKTAKLTNVSTGQVMQRYNCSESEPWCCCWSLGDANTFFVGTKRGQIFEYDTRSADPLPKRQLDFPDHLPIIGMCHVPRVSPQRGGRAPSCPSGGILVQTLNSIWFLEEVVSDAEDQEYKPHKLAIDGPFWSIRFDSDTRLFLVSTKPRPHSKHLVCDLTRVEGGDGAAANYAANVLFSEHRGGSNAGRQFLRSALAKHPDNENQLIIHYARGSGQSDQRIVTQEVGSEQPMHESPVRRPVLDVEGAICINGDRFVALLCESDVLMYKWTRMD